MQTGTPEGGPRADQLGGEIGAKHTAKGGPAQRYPHAAGFKDRGAGKDAAEAFASKVGFRRAEVLAVFDQVASATPDEVASVIERPPHVTRPRVSELFLLGELVKTGERRTSAFGAAQTVYRRATPEEHALFAARKASGSEHGEAA